MTTAEVTSPVIIRRAQPLDRDVLAAIKIASWISTYSPLVPSAVLARFVDPDHQLGAFERQLADPTQRVLVAVDADRLVGFVTWEPAHANGPYIDSLHIAPDRRSGGVGQRLLATVAESLVADGLDTLHLHVLEGNARARSFYARLGGRDVGRGPAAWAPEHVVEITYRWNGLGALAHL